MVFYGHEFVIRAILHYTNNLVIFIFLISRFNYIYSLFITSLPLTFHVPIPTNGMVLQAGTLWPACFRFFFIRLSYDTGLMLAWL